MDDDVYQLAMQHSKENPFNFYLDYKKNLNELSEEEKEFLQGEGYKFVCLIETTKMSKVYKMPVLMAFYNHGDIRMEVTEQQLLASWKESCRRYEPRLFHPCRSGILRGNKLCPSTFEHEPTSDVALECGIRGA